MTPRLGQALRWLKRLISAALALVVVASLGLAGLAWRLAQGPLSLPPLARQIERSVNAGLDGARLEVGDAAIAWEGWSGTEGAPLDIRLSEVRLHDPAGAPRIRLPEAAITLSVRALLRGTLAPATIELRRLAMLVIRAEDGSIGLDLGGGAAARPEGPPASETPPPAAEDTVFRLLADLMEPPSDSKGAHAALRRIRINGGQIAVVDRAMDRLWALTDPQIDIRRPASGGLVAEGASSVRSGEMVVPVRLTGTASGRPMRLALGIALPALRPPQLAAIWPPLAPLAVLDTAVSLTATALLDETARPERVQARLESGAGSLDLGGGRRLPFTGIELAAEGAGQALRVTRARLGLAGTALEGTGEAALRDGAWQATLDLRAEPLQAAALPRLWPEALAPEARAAVLRGLPAGLLQEARLRLSLTAPEALERVELAEARLALGMSQAVFDLGPGRRFSAESADLALAFTPGLLRLERMAMRLPGAAGPGGAGRPGPVLAASGEARRAEAGPWRARLDLALDAVAFATLPTYWPAGLASGGERDWITRNITAGEIRNGAWRIEAEAPETLDALRVTALSGKAEAVDATVHWLRPIPPVQGVSGTAEFGLTEITIRARGGRQHGTEGGRGAAALDLREGTVRFLGLDASPGQAEIAVQLAGPLSEAMAVVRHPRLKLFERRKLEIGVAAGTAEARLQIGLPLLSDLPMEALRIRVNARIAEARLPNALLGEELEAANLDLAVTTESLRVTGAGVLVGAPVRLALDMDFRGGPAGQVTERATLSGRPEARQLARLGLDAGRLLTGPVGFEARYERRRSGTAQVALRGDLRDARLGLDFISWAKPPGAPGTAEGTLRLQGDTLQTVEGFRVDALDLALRGRASFGPRARIERVEFAEGSIGESRFTGELRRPEAEGGPWLAALRGPLLDIRPMLGPAPARPPPPARGAASAAEETGPPVQLDFRFDRVGMGERRSLLAVQGRARTDARGVLREAQAGGRTAPQGGRFEFSLTPSGQRRVLRLTAEDGGALLRALDLVDTVQGGRLTVNASYAEMRPGAPLSGTAELEGFAVHDAPGLGKVLQAMTLYGLVEAMRGGGGLVFSRLVAPFTLTPEALALADARAFSASLGLTAKGRIWRERKAVDIEGTIVPAYMFNALLGNIPILGRLFSPEAGGGLFAATYRMQGPFADPAVTVNPLAALTPGFLRGLFGIFDGGGGGGGANR